MVEDNVDEDLVREVKRAEGVIEILPDGRITTWCPLLKKTLGKDMKCPLGFEDPDCDNCYCG